MRHRQILTGICERHDISLEELQGPSRKPHLVDARRALIAALHGKGCSLTDIGGALGGRDHTTIIHHLRKMGLANVDKGRLNKKGRRPTTITAPHDATEERTTRHE